MQHHIFGEEYRKLLAKAHAESYALPAVNVVSSTTASAAIEAAAQVGSDIIVQISAGGAQFFAGKGIEDKFEAQVAGAIAFAHYTKAMARLYGVRVVIHTDHANRELLPWVERLVEAGEEFYAKTGEPLFSSHMLDLSEEALEENVATCKALLPRMAAIETALEFEIGITGGEEDGIDNSDVDNEDLYTKPEEVLYAYNELDGLGTFTIAAAFGNVHGVYKPGNVHLRPELLQAHQEKIVEEKGLEAGSKPVHFVFHGGSGSEKAAIAQAVQNGVWKLNIDTDTQFAFAKPVRDYVVANEDRMSRQVGSAEDPDVANKKILDPRVWLRDGQKGMVQRLAQAYEDLGGAGKKL